MQRRETNFRSVAGTSRHRTIDIESALLDSDNSDSDLDDLVDGADAGWTGGESDSEDPDDSEHSGDDPDEQDLPGDDDGAPQRKRRTLQKNRLVNSLDASLNIENYNEYKFPDEKKEYTAVLVKKAGNIPEKKITWQNFKRNRVGRQGKENVMNIPSGPQGIAQDAQTPLQSFLIFVSDDMIEHMTYHTNKNITNYINGMSAELRAKVVGGNKYTWIKLTDTTEIKAYIGLCYLRGIFQQNNWSYRRIFSDMIGHPVFLSTMCANRFSFLNSHYSLDDPETRSDRWKQDRFAAAREVFEEFNNNCAMALQADDFMAIDECLYPCRNQVAHKIIFFSFSYFFNNLFLQVAMKQYNPNKPAKYGLLFKELNSVRVPFTHRSEVYAGKPEEPGPYYIKGVEEITLRLVDKYSDFCEIQGRNITTDNLYTSISLGQELLDRGVTLLGTLRKNRKGIPIEIKDTTGREENSSVIWWEKERGKFTLISYVVHTKSSGVKNVLGMSTMPPLLGTTIDDGKEKPAPLKLYDHSKGRDLF